MEANTNYYFDTYALIEIISGNERYRKYAQIQPLINDFTLAEIIYWVERSQHPKKREVVQRHKDLTIRAPLKVIETAMKFRRKHLKKKLSYADAIGYQHAMELGVKFLTGDKEFANLPNVEFIR